MYKFSSFLLLCFLSSQIFAQSIKGTVKDINNEVVAFATVRLLNSVDSTLLKGTAADENGNFKFGSLAVGKYQMIVTAVSFKMYEVDINVKDAKSNIVLPVIIMYPAEDVVLNEVVVKSKRPLIEQEIDKTVVNVESMISAASSNTLEVLEKVPGVVVSFNGKIALNGRDGVLVLIDGRPTYMSAQDLSEYLKSIPGSLLEKIELIDNPSAKYDAEGNAIINIRLKKNKIVGFNGSFSTGYSQGRYGINNNSLNINFRKNKLNIFGNIGYRNGSNFTDVNSERNFYSEEAELVDIKSLSNYQKNKYNSLNGNFGVDYMYSPSTTYGFLMNINETKNDGRINYISNDFNSDSFLEEIVEGGINEKNINSNINTGFYLIHKLGEKGRQLSGDLNYLNYRFTSIQSIQNFVHMPTGELMANDKFLYDLPSNINIYTAKMDYVHPFTNNSKIESGFKSSVVDNDNVFNYYTIQGTTKIVDNSKSNHFKYRENINAAYVNVQKYWKQWGAQVGLRAENTQALGQAIRK